MSPLKIQLRQVLERRWVPWCLCVLLLINAILQPGESWIRRTTIGSIFFVGSSSRITPRTIHVWVFRAPGSMWRLIRDTTDLAPPNEAVMVLWNRQQAESGVWSLIIRRNPDTVDFLDADTLAPTPYDLDNRIAMIDAVRRLKPEMFSDQPPVYYASGGSTTTRILWLGVLNDLFVLLLFIALGCSLVLNVKRIRGERRRRDLLRNLCPSCGYSLKNLRGPICPECGKPLIE